MPPTAERRSARTAGGVAIACAVAFVALLSIQGLGPRSFLLFTAPIFAACGGVVALIISLVVSKQADRHEALLRGEGRLVEWLVDEEAWKRFRALDGAESTKKLNAVKWILRLFPSLFVLASVGVLFDDPGAWELAVLFFVIAVGFAGLGVWLERSARDFATRDEAPSSATIGRDGLSFRGRFVPFRGFGIAFTGAAYDASNGLLRIRYQVSGGDTAAEHEVRVPVPSGRGDEARKVAEQLHL